MLSWSLLDINGIIDSINLSKFRAIVIKIIENKMVSCYNQSAKYAIFCFSNFLFVNMGAYYGADFQK